MPGHVADRTNPFAHGIRNLWWDAIPITVGVSACIACGPTFLYWAFYGERFEPSVRAFDDITRAELATTHPELLYYIDRPDVDTIESMLQVGIATVALARFGVRRVEWWVFVHPPINL